jgi:hypothetical protein
MRFYCVTVSYQDHEFVPVAESLCLEPMKQLAELICRHARPEISWVKIENDDGELFFYWSAASYGDKEIALLLEPTVSEYLN